MFVSQYCTENIFTPLFFYFCPMSNNLCAKCRTVFRLRYIHSTQQHNDAPPPPPGLLYITGIFSSH